MQTIQSASWLDKHTLLFSDEEPEEDEEIEEDEELPTRFWCRTDPPALAWRNEYPQSWALTVREADRTLYTSSNAKNCTLFTNPKVLTVEELLKNVLFPPPTGEEGSAEQKERLAHWQREVVEREGQSVIRWYRETTQEKFHVADTIWTDPATHRIIARECRETDPMTGRPVSVQVCSDYRYNEELPENAFEMPPGKPIVERDLTSHMPEVWETLSAQERHALQALLRRSEIAWQNANFAEFAALWNFNLVSNVPRDTEWKERLLEQAEAGSRWESQIESANKQDFIPVTIAVHAFHWVKQRHKILLIRSRLSVSWQEGGVWEGVTEYCVRRRGRGFRIVHWEAPWEEIKEARRRSLAA